ncbi:MAG TPA: glycan-binding surface protein [Chitinophagaceae bacterium]|nr:glycan-binding surface protein [Chitinophagaceae bacterium]
MKNISRNINRCMLALAVVVSTLALYSCKKDSIGPPQIDRVRLLDPTKRDSSFVKAFPGTFIVIEGRNFSGLKNVYFNGMEAAFNAALNTDNNIIIRIPYDAPTAVTDPNVPNKIRVVTDHGEAMFDFQIVAPPPAILSASNENALPGAVITLRGTNFWLLTNIVFPGNVSVTNFTVNSTATELTVTVPATATAAGPIVANGQFGSGTSVFVFNNHKSPTPGFLANFEDGDPYFGWAWWGGIKENNAYPSNTGNYIRVKPSGTINAGDGAWYTDNRAVMVAPGAWMTNDKLSDPIGDYALKFEINTKVPWTAGSLMIAPNGNFNRLARYAPWETAPNKQFVTNGWQTVTIPLTEFKSGSGNYNPSGSPAANIGVLTGGTNTAPIQIMLYNDGSTPLTAFDVAIDNVRIVKIR